MRAFLFIAFAALAQEEGAEAPPPAPPPPPPPPPPPAPPPPPPPPPKAPAKTPAAPPPAPPVIEQVVKPDPHTVYDDHFHEERFSHHWKGRVPDQNESDIVAAEVHSAKVPPQCGVMPAKRAISHEWHIFAETPEKCCSICELTSRCTMWTWGTGHQGHFMKCWITTSESKLEDAPGFITGLSPPRKTGIPGAEL